MTRPRSLRGHALWPSLPWLALLSFSGCNDIIGNRPPDEGGAGGAAGDKNGDGGKGSSTGGKKNHSGGESAQADGGAAGSDGTGGRESSASGGRHSAGGTSSGGHASGTGGTEADGSGGSPSVCEASQALCVSDTEIATCNEAGTAHSTPTSCGEGKYCDPEENDCLDQLCTPSLTTCSGNVLQTCNTVGSDYSSAVDCGESSKTCLDGDGAPQCGGVCAPSEGHCDDFQPQTCDQGAWVNSGAACTGQSTSICSPISGACVSRAFALWPMPNSPSAGLQNPMNYTFTAGVVTDRVTGLSWQRVPTEEDHYVHTLLPNAFSYCATLDLEGFTDWRLPSRIELLSLVNLALSSRTMDWNAFPSGPSDLFISASVLSGSGSITTHYGIDFSSGLVYSSAIAGAVRCVRAGTEKTESHYTSENGIVSDLWTGLSWQQSSVGSPMTWAAADSYCSNLDGSGWRLPSYGELNSLVMETGNWVIDRSVFLDSNQVLSGRFWSSSAISGTGKIATVWFGEGTSSETDPTGTHYVRCVK